MQKQTRLFLWAGLVFKEDTFIEGCLDCIPNNPLLSRER